MNVSVELRRPNIELFGSFMEFVEEMRADGQPLWAPYLPNPGEAPNEFVERLLAREIHPETPFVPETVYWGVIAGIVVGRISLRHYLSGNLSKIGGHIGYEVRPSYRRQSVATTMLKLLLETRKAKEVGRLLLTCAPNNIASNKTIQSNGGIFTQRIFVDLVNDNRNHYWIDLDDRFVAMKEGTMIVHTILYVSDQKRSTEFYSRLLQLQPNLDVPGMTEFQLTDGHVLGLMPEAGIKRLLGELLPDPAKGSGVPRVELYIRVAEPEPYFDRAMTLGAIELSPILERPWGGRAGYVMDTDGHVLALAT